MPRWYWVWEVWTAPLSGVELSLSADIDNDTWHNNENTTMQSSRKRLLSSHMPGADRGQAISSEAADLAERFNSCKIQNLKSASSGISNFLRIALLEL